jgi:hypothetical protein
MYHTVSRSSCQNIKAVGRVKLKKLSSRPGYRFKNLFWVENKMEAELGRILYNKT